jgi:hypothetical protein
MADTATDNPYKPASLSSGVMPVGLTRVQAVLVALLAIVLLLRGGFMLFSWGMQLFSGFRLDSHFNAAIVTKDGIYGISAFIGGLMLLARNRIGWWFALVHWCWCVGSLQNYKQTVWVCLGGSCKCRLMAKKSWPQTGWNQREMVQNIRIKQK